MKRILGNAIDKLVCTRARTDAGAEPATHRWKGSAVEANLDGTVRPNRIVNHFQCFEPDGRTCIPLHKSTFASPEASFDSCSKSHISRGIARNRSCETRIAGCTFAKLVGGTGLGATRLWNHIRSKRWMSPAAETSKIRALCKKASSESKMQKTFHPRSEFVINFLTGSTRMSLIVRTSFRAINCFRANSMIRCLESGSISLFLRFYAGIVRREYIQSRAPTLAD